MSGLEVPGIIILVIVAFVILLIEIFVYFTRMARTAESDPEHPGDEKDDGLLSIIQAGFQDIVKRSADFQEQIRLLQIAITMQAAVPDALLPDSTRKFNENSLQIDRLSEQYSLLTQNLVDLFQEETGITSPERLHDHRLREIGTIRELSALSNRIQPLLDENIAIVSPVLYKSEDFSRTDTLMQCSRA